MTDQEHLNALVGDCYGGQWPWRTNDHVLSPDGTAYTIGIDEGRMRTYGVDLKGCYPLADTWVIGSLIEKMGEAFHSLNRAGHVSRKELKYLCRSWAGKHYGKTPIAALCAALRAVLQQQKGVNHETSSS